MITEHGGRNFPKSKHVRITERDHLKERLFKDAYKLNAKIRTTTYNDERWNWDMVVLNFTDDLDKHYGLIEYFKEGDDNSTDHVDFEYEDKDGNWKVERFDKKNTERGKIYVTAELAMVRLMQRRLQGDD